MHLPGSCLCPRSSDLAWVTVTQVAEPRKRVLKPPEKPSKGVRCKNRRFDGRYFSSRGFAASFHQFLVFLSCEKYHHIHAQLITL